MFGKTYGDIMQRQNKRGRERKQDVCDRKAQPKLGACFLINKPLSPRRRASGKADFSCRDSGRLEEHLVMEMTGKQPHAPKRSNHKTPNMCGFAKKTVSPTV